MRTEQGMLRRSGNRFTFVRWIAMALLAALVGGEVACTGGHDG